MSTNIYYSYFSANELASNTGKQSRQTNTIDAPPLFSATETLKLLNWTPLGIRRHKHRFIFKCIDGLIDFDLIETNY